MTMTLDGSGANTIGVPNSATAKSATGTAVDFTGIPSGTKRITVGFSGISTSGSSDIIIQLGTGSTTWVTSGYLGSANGGNTVVAATTYTTGLGLSKTGNVAAASVTNGTAQFMLIGSNVWAGSTVNSNSNTNNTSWGSTSVSIGAPLTALRITMANGTDTFDAGTINILYE